MVATLGMGTAYIAITAFFAVSLALTLGVARDRPRKVEATSTDAPSQPTSPWRDLRDVFVYVWNTSSCSTLAGTSALKAGCSSVAIYSCQRHNRGMVRVPMIHGHTYTIAVGRISGTLATLPAATPAIIKPDDSRLREDCWFKATVMFSDTGASRNTCAGRRHWNTNCSPPNRPRRRFRQTSARIRRVVPISSSRTRHR